MNLPGITAIAPPPTNRTCFANKPSVRFGHDNQDIFSSTHAPPVPVETGDGEQLILRAPGFSPDKAWAQSMWREIEDAVTQIYAGKLNTAHQILDKLSKKYKDSTGRGEWLADLSQGRGVSVSSGPGAAESAIVRRAAYRDRSRVIACSGQDVSTLTIPELKERFNITGVRINGFAQVNRIHIRHQDDLDMIGTLLGVDASGEEKLAWSYVDGPTKQRGLDKAENLADQLLSHQGALSFKQQQQVINQIASIHWWMVQSMPFDGGTAGISDMFTKTLFMSKGFRTAPWKEGVVPDMEALTMSLSDFVQAYSSFFEYPPQYGPLPVS